MPDILHDHQYQKSSCETLDRLIVSGMVDAKDRNFVASLLKQYNQKHTLSPKQWPWIEKMMIRALGLDAKLSNLSGPKEGAEATGFAVDAKKLFDLFVENKAKLKHPSLLFGVNTDHGVKQIKIYPHKDGLKINWYESTSAYSVGMLYSNEMIFSSYLDDVYLCGVEAAVKALCEDPVHQVAEHGKVMNKCSFCGKTLTDKISVLNGYGPTCAKNWGLAWITPVGEE